MKNLTILDVTIRDGSYAIDYKYTAAQVAAIAGALDAAGIHYIEVSHGSGLGAAENLGLYAAATDAEYVAAAKSAVKKSKIGVIAGSPPVTFPHNIDTIIDDVDFIRFASNCDRPQLVEPNIKYALKKRPKLPVFLQLMRSSRRTKKDLLAAGRVAADMGVCVMYVVDTAGYYRPDQVSEIVALLTAKLKIGIGFHGHNNLGLAVANTLSAVEAGATSVDASLRGIGRAGGNAGIEALVSLLKRLGYIRHVDLDKLLDAGERLVAPIMPPLKGTAKMDIVTADANIDLYPLSKFEEYSKNKRIDLVKLIRKFGKDKKIVEPVI